MAAKSKRSRRAPRRKKNHWLSGRVRRHPAHRVPHGVLDPGTVDRFDLRLREVRVYGDTCPPDVDPEWEAGLDRAAGAPSNVAVPDWVPELLGECDDADAFIDALVSRSGKLDDFRVFERVVEELGKDEAGTEVIARRFTRSAMKALFRKRRR